MIKIFLIGIIYIKNQNHATYFSNLICGLLGRRRADELLLRCAAGWSSQQKLSLSILGCAGVDTHRGRLKDVWAALRCVRVGAGRRKLREIATNMQVASEERTSVCMCAPSESRTHSPAAASTPCYTCLCETVTSQTGHAT